MNARMSREMETVMDFMQTQISRTITCAISERIIPEIQKMVEICPWTNMALTRLRPQMRIESEISGKTQVRSLQRRTPGPPVIWGIIRTLLLTASKSGGEIKRSPLWVFFGTMRRFFRKISEFYQKVPLAFFWSFRFVKTFNEPEWPLFQFFGTVQLFKQILSLNFFFQKYFFWKKIIFFQMFPIVVPWIFLSLRVADLGRSRLVNIRGPLLNAKCFNSCKKLQQKMFSALSTRVPIWIYLDSLSSVFW